MAKARIYRDRLLGWIEIRDDGTKRVIPAHKCQCFDDEAVALNDEDGNS